MAIFKGKKKQDVQMAEAPEDTETAGEKKYMEAVENKDSTVSPIVENQSTPQVPQIREIPRCMSQTQINNLIIDMDLKLNYIISKMEE